MATTGTRPAVPTKAGLQELAKRHLWMHFTRHGAFAEADVPIIVRGEGAYVWDEHGNRYLDGLSALFCVNVGHGRTELGEAAARQVEELDFYTLWSYAHPRAIELATRIASLAPDDLNRVFFTSGGSEAVESAIKLARAYHQRTGNPRTAARGASRRRPWGRRRAARPWSRAPRGRRDRRARRRRRPYALDERAAAAGQHGHPAVQGLVAPPGRSSPGPATATTRTSMPAYTASFSALGEAAAEAHGGRGRGRSSRV